MALIRRGKSTGNLDLFSSPSSLNQDLDLFSKSESSPKTSFQDIIDYGPMARGVQFAEKGVQLRDAPYLASKMVSGRLMGVPEMVAKNPIAAFTQAGANIAERFGGSNLERPISQFSMMPKPQTVAGGEAGQELGLLSSLVPAAEMASAIPQLAMAKRFNKAIKPSEKGKQLSEQLIKDSESARKTVGTRYENYLKQYGDDLIDAEKTTDLFKKMPKSLIEEVKNNPLIEKVTNQLGQVIIKPTVRNAKYIRDIVKGDVSAKYWNSQLVEETERKAANYIYDNLGKIMREGRPDLKNIMSNYSQVRNAGKELFNSLRTKSGYFRSKPIETIFKKGADTAKQEAVNVIVKYYPRAKTTRDAMVKLASSKEFQKTASKIGKQLIPWGVGLFGAERISRRF